MYDSFEEWVEASRLVYSDPIVRVLERHYIDVDRLATYGLEHFFSLVYTFEDGI